MIRHPPPRAGVRVLRLTAWSLVLGLAWLLLGQQFDGQPVIHSDFTAGLPGAAPTDARRARPVRAATAQHQRAVAPDGQISPQSSPTSLTATSQAAARAVTFAVNQRGKPYQWGAEGPGAYDCSGLTWLAWQHAGLSWERMTAAGHWQWLYSRGHEVPATQLRAGDLLFYANDCRDPASIHHVAMAIGNGRMVEAPEPGIPVRVVPARWTGFFAAARPTNLTGLLDR